MKTDPFRSSTSEEPRTTDSPGTAKSVEVPLSLGAEPGGLCASEEPRTRDSPGQLGSRTTPENACALGSKSAEVPPPEVFGSRKGAASSMFGAEPGGLCASEEPDFERLYRLQVEELRDYALFLIDSDGIIASWNAGVQTILGFRREDFVGKPFADLFTPEDRAASAPQTEMRIATDQGRSADMRWHVRKDGTRMFAEGFLYAIREGDRHVGFSKVMRDATVRHQAQEALQRSHDDLADFAHVVSHDLQAPLRTMRSYSQLLSRRFAGQLDSDADTYISFIVEGAQNMEELIRGLLQYSEFGRGEGRRRFSLEEALQNAIANLKVPLAEAGAAVTNDPLPEIEANPTQIQQVLQNLIGNSLKYRSKASPRIHIGAVRVDGFWRISVQDNGVGIPEEHSESVFQPLKRLHGHEIAGTGLGLAVCRRVVESGGGRIWVQSKPGSGATFLFTVPAP